MVSSGTEATMSALRLARGATGRDRIVKIDGGYHGHADCLLVKAGSGAATLGLPGSAGVTPATAADTATVAWNDLDALAAAFRPHAGSPIAVGDRRAGLRQHGLRAAARRLPRGRARADARVRRAPDLRRGDDRLSRGVRRPRRRATGIEPDLTCLGKIIGGGLPAAAYGGREDLMRKIAPDGAVYQAGTLSAIRSPSPRA